MKERYIRHPLFGTSLKNWIRLITDNGGIDRGFYLRAVFVTISIIFFTPARILEKIIYGKKIKDTKIKKPPIFIIGHWRSGTTMLHELIAMDQNIAYVSLWNTLLPESFLILNPLKEIIAQFLPKTRPMDEIKVQISGPYEEEAGVSTILPWSFFHCFMFPKNAERQFQTSVLFNGIKKEEIEEWKNGYLWLIRKVTYANNQKRLILKSPANTARIKTLLELFPNARFIHIYRNPYKVYFSTRKMRKNVLNQYAFQDTSEEEIKKHVVDNYIKLMDEFYKQKHMIPRDKFVEISYEDLVSNPLEVLEKIYSELNLDDFDKAKAFFEKYLLENKKYKPNKYSYDKEMLKEIKDKWNKTIKKWKYSPP